ncbi:hypothetical protein V2J09_012208 [Rumex salicifolius]
MEGGAVGVWCRKNEKVVHLLIALCLGQVVSFVMALMSFSSSYLADLGVDAPLTQSFFMYLSLAVVYGSIMLYRRKKFLVPWYYYILLGFVDVQGNYLVNKAYQYSSITSVTLLDCWTIPWVFILTWFFIGTRYSIWQYVGAAICIVGLGLIFLSDAGVGGDDGSRPILGDILVVLGTLFYALSNVGELPPTLWIAIVKLSFVSNHEFCVKMKDLVEVVCMIGIFGMLVSIGEIAIFERISLESIEWSTDIILGFCAYAFASFLFYVFAPYVLKFSGAALFNLSLLTSDMWAVLVRIFFYKQQVDWLYYVSFGLVVVGLLFYSKTQKEAEDSTTPAQQTTNGDYQILDGQETGSRIDNNN